MFGTKSQKKRFFDTFPKQIYSDHISWWTVLSLCIHMTRLYYLRDFLTITVCAVCLEEEDYVIRKYTAWAMRWDDFIQGGVFYWFTGLLVSTVKKTLCISSIEMIYLTRQQTVTKYSTRLTSIRANTFFFFKINIRKRHQDQNLFLNEY